MPRFSGTFPNGIKVSGIPFYGSAIQPDSSGSVYFVDGNSGSDGNTGKSWEDAFATLAKACTVSHADIARGSDRWARRNTIFVAGDALTEDLTALAQKTDIIGVGTCDGFGPGARIKGNHVIDSTSYAGCRLINLAFIDNDATGTILTIPTQQSGIQILGCDFLSGTATVIGVLATASSDLIIKGCRFLGSWTSSFSTAAISIGAGTGHRNYIEDNYIENTHATGVGILVNASRVGAGSWIRGNNLSTTAMAIDENSDTFNVVDNRCVVGTAKAADTSVDIPAAKSVNNIITGSDGTISVPSCNYGAQS